MVSQINPGLDGATESVQGRLGVQSPIRAETVRRRQPLPLATTLRQLRTVGKEQQVIEDAGHQPEQLFSSKTGMDGPLDDDAQRFLERQVEVHQVARTV